MPARSARKTNHHKQLRTARSIAKACMQLSHASVSDQFLDAVATHIVAQLPKRLMRQLMAGNWRNAQWHAMKLAAPFFVP